MPDRSSEGEDALQYSRCDACDGAPAVVFQVELGHEGVVDRLDDLPERLEVAVCGPWFLALRAGRSSLTSASVSAASNAFP